MAGKGKSVYLMHQEVLTSYGWGYITSNITKDCDDCHGVIVVIDEWTDEVVPITLYTSSDHISSSSFCHLGNTVLTRYGTGILLDYVRLTQMHVVRLWGCNGGLGSSIAYLNRDTIVKCIPYVVGMTVQVFDGSNSGDNQGVIVAYNEHNETYIVNILKSNEFVTASSEKMKAITDTKFMPLAFSFVRFISRNCRQYTKYIDPLIKLLRTIQNDDANLDVKNMMSILTIKDGNFMAQKLKMVELVKSFKSCIVNLQSSIKGDENGSSNDHSDANDTANSLQDIAMSSKPIIDPIASFSLDQLDALLQKLEFSVASNETDILDLSTLVTDMTTLLYSSTSNLYDSSGILYQNANNLMRDPNLAGILDEIKFLHENFNDKVIFLTKLVSQVSTLLSGSKTIQVLSSGTEQLRQRMNSIIESNSDFIFSSKDILAKGHNLLVDNIPSLVEKKVKEENLLHLITSKMESPIGVDGSSQSSFLNSSLAYLLNKFGLRESMTGDSQFILIALLSLNDKNINIFSNEWYLKLESKICQILQSMSGGNSGNMTSFEIRKLMRSPLECRTDIIKNGFNFESLLTNEALLSNEYVSGFVKKIGLDKDLKLDTLLSTSIESFDTIYYEDAARKMIDIGGNVLTSLESLKENTTIRNALSHAKAIDLNDNIMSRVKDINLSGVLTMVENVITDEQARKTLIDRVKDDVLDFLLQYIPTLSLPDLDGISDDIQYTVLGLDLSGFKFKKEDVVVELGELPAISNGHEVFSFQANGINAKFKGLKWRYSQTYFPHFHGDGVADARVENSSLRIGFKFVRVPKGTTGLLSKSLANGSLQFYQKHPQLIEKVSQARNATDKEASVDNKQVTDSFSDPVSDWGAVMEDWEPALVISDCKITIESLLLNIDNTSFSWVYNMLASVFSVVIKEYVCTNIRDIIHFNSATLLSTINGTVGDYWQMIKEVLNIELGSLPIASVYDIASLLGPITDTSSADFNLKFDEEGSLGLQLDVRKRVSDDGKEPNIKLVITSVVQGSQAVNAVELSGLQLKEVEGASIRSVNGKLLSTKSSNDALAALKGPKPISISIRLTKRCNEIRLRRQKQSLLAFTGKSSPNGHEIEKRRALKGHHVLFQTGSLGLKLKDTKSCGGAIIITAFTRGPKDEILQAEAFGCLKIGMIMLSVNKKVVFGMPSNEVMEIIKSNDRPLSVVFVSSPDHQVTISHSNVSSLKVYKMDDHVVVSSHFSDGALGEQAILPGSVLLRVNKMNITSTMAVKEVMEIITDGLPAQVAVRDMDSFMHLIRLRDGIESLEKNVKF